MCECLPCRSFAHFDVINCATVHAYSCTVVGGFLAIITFIIT